MKKNTKKEITEFLKKTIEGANVTNYELVTFENDDDINFIITPKLNGKTTPRQAQLKFILYYSSDNTITLYCPILYKMGAKNSIMFTLNTINNINSQLAVGKLYMSDNNSTISYINRIFFNDITNDLTSGLLKEYIDAFLYCSVEFYMQMKVDQKNEENT